MNELIGKKVIVYSVVGGGEQRDVGTLEAIEGPFLRVRKGENEVLFFSVYQVRLVKPFDAHS